MNRREFIAGLGSAVAWPLTARAQQRMPVIGYLSSVSANTTTTLAPFLQGLKETGFVEGQNIAIEYRWADGHNDRLPAMAAELVNLNVAVICAIGGRLPAIAAKAATATIPIVFQSAGDPVDDRLVASLNHPGGNATGSLNLTGGPIDAKALQFLREVVPATASLGLLANPTNRSPEFVAPAAARDLRWEFQVFEASTDDDLKTAFETMAEQKVGAVNVVPDTFFTSRRAQIVALAAQYAVPASYANRAFVIAGGLMSYGSDFKEASRVAGNYAGRILKGEKPSDLPVQQPTKIELVLNLKTAKTLGITFPPALLGRADEVIE
jgi:putative tryptophan/tyrosine transport system substrate-binding protein